MKSNVAKTSCKQGFTLIELLVEVLNIGILAAIAVPQYKLAVAKSKYVQLMVMGNSIWQAEKMYYLANGKYTSNLNELDMDFFPTVFGRYTYLDSKRYCYVNVEDSMQEVYCVDSTNKARYFRDFKKDSKSCSAVTDASDAEKAFVRKLCTNLSGQNKGETATWWGL